MTLLDGAYLWPDEAVSHAYKDGKSLCGTRWNVRDEKPYKDLSHRVALPTCEDCLKAQAQVPQ